MIRWVVFLALVAPGGCAYTMSERSVPGHIETVAVPVLENETAEPGLQQELTDALGRAFVDDGTLTVVPQGQAHSIVYGVIRRYSNVVSGYSEDESTEEYEVTLVVEVEYQDLVKRKTLWDETITGRTRYSAVDTSGRFAQTELEGRAEAVTQVVTDVLARVLRGGDAW